MLYINFNATTEYKKAGLEALSNRPGISRIKIIKTFSSFLLKGQMYITITMGYAHSSIQVKP